MKNWLTITIFISALYYFVFSSDQIQQEEENLEAKTVPAKIIKSSKPKATLKRDRNKRQKVKVTATNTMNVVKIKTKKKVIKPNSDKKKFYQKR